MQKRRPMMLLLATAAIALTGCAGTRISGEGIRQEQIVHGELGLSGEDIVFTVLDGSQVSKLSIIGDDIRVFVRHGAVVDKIEIVGEDNEVSVPADATFEYSAIGEENRVIRD
jgi:hypothetical protein